MTSARIELANPNLYATPQEYIEKHLAPVVAELHRALEEVTSPIGEKSTDMIPLYSSLKWSPLDAHLDNTPKHFIFDGAAYEKVPTELLRQKQLKVQLNALVYVIGGGSADFRLMRYDGLPFTGEPVIGSTFETDCHEPTSFTLTLPFGNTKGCVAPERRSYIIEARSVDSGIIPVCRRFSMSFVYI